MIWKTVLGSDINILRPAHRVLQLHNISLLSVFYVLHEQLLYLWYLQMEEQVLLLASAAFCQEFSSSSNSSFQ